MNPDTHTIMEQEKINICFAIDGTFAEHCAVTITSILMNSAAIFHFYILHSNISREGRQKIDCLKKIKACEITFVSVNENDFEECYLPFGSHFSIATYFRLKIASLLPDISKTIYLDSDIIVNRDLKELWNICFDNSYILGCKSMTHRKNCKRLGLSPDANYINSGVMVLDLEKLRKDNIEDELMACAKQKKNTFNNADQDVINLIFSEIDGGIKLVQQNWNTEMRTDIPFEKEYLKVIRNPYIIHFVTADKPWNIGSRQVYKEEYWKYENELAGLTDSTQIKGVVYTCITGGYDKLVNHSYHDPDWDYVCFTDDLTIKNAENSKWKLKSLQFNKLDKIRNQKWHKLHPHILFPEYYKSVWVDANLEICTKAIFEDVNNAVEDKRLLSIAPHPVRNCIYSELTACMILGKDDPEIMKAQIALIKEDNFPERLGLFENNIIYRNHNDELLITVMEHWWWWIKNYSHRDQLSLAYVLWKQELCVIPLTYDTYRNDDGRLRIHSHVSKQIGILNSRLVNLNAQISQQAGIIEELEAQITQIKLSRSWKLTRPLRVAARLLRCQLGMG